MNNQQLEPIGFSTLKDYLEKKKIIKFKTRLEELVSPYLKYLKWDNQTIQQDMTTLFVTLNQCTKRPEEIVSILRWAKTKNSVHPLGIVKLLRK